MCSGEGLPRDQVLDTVARLVNRSLVLAETADDGRTHYQLLETVRAYAAERVADGAAARDRHAEFYSALAMSVAGEFWTARAGAAVVRLNREHDNLRSALRWLIGCGRAEQAQALGAALVRFWILAEHWSEADAWIAELVGLGTLPARLNRVLFWPSLGKHLMELWRAHVFGGPGQAEVVLGPLLSSVMTPAGPASDVCLFAHPWA